MDWLPVGSAALRLVLVVSGCLFGKDLHAGRIYWSMLWYFFKEIIEYIITNEEPAQFWKKIIRMWIIDKTLPISLI